MHLDELVNNSLGNEYEFKCLLRLVDAEQEEPSKCIDCHNVIEVPLNRFIKLRNNRLCFVDCLEPSLELLLLSMHQGQKFERQHLLLPVEIK